jgi:hypothetical protein
MSTTWNFHLAPALGTLHQGKASKFVPRAYPPKLLVMSSAAANKLKPTDLEWRGTKTESNPSASVHIKAAGGTQAP